MSVTLVIQQEMRMHHVILSPLFCQAIPYTIFPHYLTNCTTLGKVAEH